ncbi:MAG: glycerophosphodiester phosphodiesterase [Clostridia bacterium]|nr:glycerophosphodiester phosphodiesterase [Clostridia bacterium]
MKLKNMILLSAGIAGAAVAAGTAIVNTKKLNDAVFPDGFTVTAHTGCEKTKDNSLDAITVGFGFGADIVEFDLSFNDEGTAVLSHDKPKGNEHTLEEAFALISGYKGLKVNVDVKKADDLPQVVEAAKKYGIPDRIFYTGIEREKVDVVKNNTPEVSYYLNTDIDKSRNNDDVYISELIQEVISLGACGINIRFSLCTKKMVDEFHKNGLLVSVWTVNRKSDMVKALALGCDNITTRKPSELKKLIDMCR